MNLFFNSFSFFYLYRANNDLGNNPDAGFPVNGLCDFLINSNKTSSFDALVDYVQSQQAGECLDVNSVGDIMLPGASRFINYFICLFIYLFF